MARLSAVALILVVSFGVFATLAPSPVYAAPCEVRVRITTITIIHDGDPGVEPGELHISTFVFSPEMGQPPPPGRIPPVGTVSKNNGDDWIVNTPIFQESADSSQFPIELWVQITVVDEDPGGATDKVGSVDDRDLDPACPFDQSYERHSRQAIGESIIRYRVLVAPIVEPILPPAAAATDWAVLSVGLNPPAPKAGDLVIFRVTMTALSTTSPYPRSVDVQCQVDGISYGGGVATFPGPTGAPLTVSTSTPWPAAVGSHTLTWSISASNDPNPGNNVMSTSFTVQPAEAPFDFSVSVSPASQTTVPGGTAIYTVTVNLVSGSAQSVALTLSGAPDSVTTTFSPSSGNPTFTSTLSFSVASSVLPGNYPVTVTGTGGGKAHTAAITLAVSQSPDFQIQVNPPSQIIGQGQTALYSINVVGLNQFNTQVSLSVSGFPSGVIGVFSTPSGTPNFASTLTVTVSGNAPAGVYTLIITGTGGGLTRTANVVLQITAVQTQTQTGPGQAPSVGLMEILQQNSLLVIGILGLLILLLAFLALRRRGPAYPPPGAQSVPSAPSAIYCANCGAQHVASNLFCGKCGQAFKK